jgi:RNA polymerase sigma factor (sigma-70 family)
MDEKELNKYLGYCRTVACHYWRHVSDILTFEDLYGAAEEGLAYALKKHKPDTGDLQSYLWKYIRGYVQMSVRKRLQDKSRCYGRMNNVDRNCVPSVEATQEQDTDQALLLMEIRRQASRLTGNERRYLELTLAGYSTHDIVAQLGVSDQWVSQIKKTVITKLRKWNRVPCEA